MASVFSVNVLKGFNDMKKAINYPKIINIYDIKTNS